MVITIREATVEDLDKILPLKLKSKEDERKSNKQLEHIKKVKKHYKDYLERDLAGSWRAVFIAVDGKKPIGLVIGKIYRSLRVAGYERRGSMSNLYITPTYRKKGLGKKLLKALMTWFKKKKVKGMTLSIYPTNKIAEKMYTKLGFQSYCKMMYGKLK